MSSYINVNNKRPCIFITSAGRTGIQFLGYKMSHMIEDCTSIHEPDLLYINRPHEWYWKIKKFGFLRMTFGKFVPRYSLRVLSIARQIGKLFDSQAYPGQGRLNISQASMILILKQKNKILNSHLLKSKKLLINILNERK